MSLTAKTAKSIFYTGSTKLVQRGLGTVSMLILARLLTPEDFGIVSICTLAVFLFNSLSDVGSKQYIVSTNVVNDDVLNTAWTINIIMKTIIWTFFMVSSPYIANFLEQPEILNPLRFLSLILLFSSLGNPGVWTLSRDLNYKPLFKMEVVSKIISFISVLLIAFYYQSYWAMLFGVVLSYLIPCILSHFICSHRPRLILSNISEQVKYSQWVIANSIIGYARGEGDSVLVAKYFNLEMIGIYTMFKNLSNMPLTQLILPATDPLLATFSTSIRAGNFRTYQMNIVMLLLLSIVVPLATLMAYFNEEIVLLFLGEKWVEHAYIFSILVYILIPTVIFKPLSVYMLADGGYKPIVYYQTFMTFITLATLYIIIDGDLKQFSIDRVLISIGSVILFSIYFQRKYKLFRLKDLVVFILPFIASSSSIFIVDLFDYSYLNWFLKLGAGCAIFSVFYCGVLFFLIFLTRDRYECSLFLSYSKHIKNLIFFK